MESLYSERGMPELEIWPEPSEEEREALEAALAGLLSSGERPVSAWWQAGIEESVLGLEEGSAERETPFAE